MDQLNISIKIRDKVDTMGSNYLAEYDEFREEEFVLCIVCKTRIGLVDDHIDLMDNERTAVFNKVFNVQVDTEEHHKQVDGKTVADTYCIECGMLLGVKLIIVPQHTEYIREGRFLMRTYELVYWNDVPMFDEEDELDRDANEQDHDHDESADDHDEGANEQDNDPMFDEEFNNELDGDANEEDNANWMEALINRIMIMMEALIKMILAKIELPMD